MTRKGTKREPVGRRPSFTLVELLTVLAIIVLLMSLSASAYVRVIRTQRIKNTEALVETLNRALLAQKQAVIDGYMQQAPPDYYLNNNNGDITRARAQWMREVVLPYEFPTTFAGAWANPMYRRMIVATGYQGAGPPAAPPPPPPPRPQVTSESSACLLMALSVTRRGRSFDPDTLAAGSVIDLDNDNIKEVRDAWADPLMFGWQTGQDGELQPVIRSPNV
jgi:type II secretory pathway pseudopilin PulG